MKLKEFISIINNLTYQDDDSEIIFQHGGEFFDDVKTFTDKDSGSVICNLFKSEGRKREDQNNVERLHSCRYKALFMDREEIISKPAALCPVIRKAMTRRQRLIERGVL